MKKTRILFVCKYNRFRSRIAEAYFNKINKNKNIKAESAGLIAGFSPLNKYQVEAAKSYGISLSGKPRAMSMDLLKKQDKIIVVADNVPKEVFDIPFDARKSYPYTKKVIIWKISDVNNGDILQSSKKIIKVIMNKVDELNRQLEKRK